MHKEKEEVIYQIVYRFIKIILMKFKFRLWGKKAHSAVSPQG